MPRASPLIQTISNIKGIFSIVGRTRKARKLWLLNYFFFQEFSSSGSLGFFFVCIIKKTSGPSFPNDSLFNLDILQIVRKIS